MAQAKALNKTQMEKFERFYANFPKKTARGDAENAWSALDPDEEMTTKLILAIQAQIRYNADRKKHGEWNAGAEKRENQFFL